MQKRGRKATHNRILAPRVRELINRNLLLKGPGGMQRRDLPGRISEENGGRMGIYVTSEIFDSNHCWLCRPVCERKKINSQYKGYTNGFESGSNLRHSCSLEWSQPLRTPELKWNKTYIESGSW